MTESMLPSFDLVAAPGPAQDLWTAAAVRESYHPEALLESWLKVHSTAPKKDQRLATRATLDLRAIGKQVSDGNGVAALRLPSLERLEVLRVVGATKALQALSAIDGESRTLTERMFETVLAEETVVPNRDDRVQLMVLDTIAPWAAAAGVTLTYDRQEIVRHLGRSDFLRTLGGQDLHRFIGRNNLRSSLERLWQSEFSENEPVLIEGPGGIGKSMTIGRFIADLLESADPTRSPDAVFHIDFDRLSLQRARRVTILQEFVRQAAMWWVVERSEELLSLARDVSSGDSQLEFSGANSRSLESTRNYLFLADRLVDLLRNSTTRAQPRIILFVDSFEQVETFDDSAAYSPLWIRDELVRCGASVFVIYASRACARPTLISKRAPIRLQQFSFRESLTYLQNEAARAGYDIPVKNAKRVAVAVGRSPLALRIAVWLLEKEGAVFDPTTWSNLARNSSELIQAALYDRLLRRIRNLELRKIARPGLLVRRLTEDVITEILAKPCGLDLSKTPPVQLMREARLEGQLFVPDPSDADALRHRQDVRTLILPNLDASIPFQIARKINEAAITYYEARGGKLLYRCEELYHRLRLGQPAKELDRRWTDEAGRALRPVLHEFSPESRAYLRARLGAASIVHADSAGHLAASAGSQTQNVRDQSNRWRELRLFAQRALLSGGWSQLLAEQLQENGADRIDGPLGDIYAELLVRRGSFDELLGQARDLATSRSEYDDGDVIAGVFTIVAATLEGRQLLGEAQTFWLQALRKVRGSDKRIELSCLVGSIRTRRKLGVTLKKREEEFRRALTIVVDLGHEIYEQRVLARESAAELSEILLHRDRDSDHVRQLISFVLETNEAFPSAVDNPQRRFDLGLRLAGLRDTRSLRELNNTVAKLIYGDDEALKQIIVALREEVDWSLAQALRRSEANNPRGEEIRI